MTIKIIDDQLLNQVSKQSKESPRLRMNYNFHQSPDDPINRLLNVMQPGTYIPPHRHLNPDKQEIFLVLKGSIAVFLFDNEGKILKKTELSPTKGKYGMEISPETWHSLIVLEPDTVLYEIKPGPFQPLSPENLAGWAPPAEDKIGVAKFIRKLEEESPL